MFAQRFFLSGCFSLAILLFGCSANRVIDASSSEQSTVADSSEPTHSERVYYFQHRLIAEWVFETEGAFFFDLYNMQVDQLLQAATELVSSEYADGITVNPIYDRNAVLIKFPEPENFANCFFALIKKQGDNYAYYTYEKTFNLGEDHIIGVVGGWDRDGGHSNFGARTYSTEEEFVEDVLSLGS